MHIEKQKRENPQRRIIGQRHPPPKVILRVQKQTLQEERDFKAAWNLFLNEMVRLEIYRPPR